MDRSGARARGRHRRARLGRAGARVQPALPPQGPATDVLSFPAEEPELPRRCRDRGGCCAAPGARGGTFPATELRVLALHGLLHLLGYDHERDDGRMARVERRLRRSGGLRKA